MKILYFCGNPYDPLLLSLRKYHRVISCGPTPNHTIKIPKHADIEPILNKTPNVNLIFILEQQPLVIPKNIEKVTIPKALYLVDLHIHYHTWHKDFARVFDLVFCAQKKYVGKLKREGLKKVFWLPLYCNPQFDRNLNLERIYDIGFVGNLNHLQNLKRSLFIWLLKKEFNTKVGQNVYDKDRTNILNQSKIGVNLSGAGDLNFRTFEAMACGSMLLTDKQDGMLDLFKDKKHLVIYNNFFQAKKIANYYLDNPKKSHEIAKNGQIEVAKRHTAENRAREILKIVKLNF